MTITMRVIRKGRVVEEKIFPQKPIDLVLNYFGENDMAPDMTKDYEKLIMASAEEENAYICIDDKEMSELDNNDFEAKYTVDYEEKIEHELYRVLSS